VETQSDSSSLIVEIASVPIETGPMEFARWKRMRRADTIETVVANG
jgi:hypothetical protein